MKIAIAGTGYVGLSLSVLLAKHNNVVAYDTDSQKVDKINSGISPIKDDLIEEYLKNGEISLSATCDFNHAFVGADFVVVSTPTNYDEKLNHFDTSSVENVIEKVLSVNNDCVIVIKSTVPVGYTKSIREKFGSEKIIFPKSVSHPPTRVRQARLHIG